MSRTAVVMSLVAAVAIFSCGYITAKLQNAGAEVAEVQKQDTQRASAKDENLANLRGVEAFYRDGVYDDTTKTDDLLHRVLRITDGVRSETAGDTADTDNLATRLKRAEAREARLRGALRIALDGNREDARRANDVARQLNLCISQQLLDRQQLAESQRR
jgi:hypothetical protein